MKEIHQIVGCLTPGDAVSNYVLYLQNLLRSEGFKSEIYAEIIAPEYEQICLSIHKYPLVDSPETILFAHYSIASITMLMLPGFQAKKILFYHNVTPYQYWLEVNSLAAFHCLRGKADLSFVLPHIQYGIAFSEFSIRDLRELGLEKTAVMPLSIDLKKLEVAADPITLAAYDRPQTKILMVGRVVPNKRIEEGIRIVSLLPDSRLIVAGSWENSAPYYYAVRELAREMKVRCDFAGSITQEQLRAFYQIADLLLIVSDHEGFCVPILEAFHYKVPVVAFAAGAIPETAKDGALLIENRDPQFSAQLISRVLQDQQLRSQLQVKGTEALQQHQNFPLKETLLKIIDEVRSSS